MAPRPADHRYWDSIRDTHPGERAFILATGHSISLVDISPLAAEFTVGINHLLRWEGLPFVPNAWAACEYDDLYKIAGDLKNITVPKWFAHPVWHSYVGKRPGFHPDDTWHWIHTDSHMNWNGDRQKWGGKLDLLGLGDEFWRVGCGHTPVMEPAIPALVWMGFREIYLLGVDHTQDDHVYAHDGNRNQRVAAADAAFRNMVPELEARGVKVRNCSPGSKAPVPFESLEGVLGQRVGMVPQPA